MTAVTADLSGAAANGEAPLVNRPEASRMKACESMFRVRAKNAIGDGPYSNNLILIAARKSDAPDAPVASSELTNVKITW